MKPPEVFIKICDEGWIIETMALRLAEALPQVRYGLSLPTDAPPIVYFLPYLTYEATNTATIEAKTTLGYFTHRDDDPVRGERFDYVAKAVDYAVFQSKRTESFVNRVRPRGGEIISPGVDQELFTPELRLGVVGRTYDSGRKGEHLLRSIQDLPYIRWHFTGTGWPQPATLFAPEEMPNFYRSLDYLVILSTNEGGPMAVLEALACGKQIIAPTEVGWVREFPHIPYACGNVESLRAVLERLIAERLALRATVATYTWKRWIEQHEALFRRIAQERTNGTRPQ